MSRLARQLWPIRMGERDQATAAGPASSAGQHSSRVGWLDALRGIAALAVVFDHMIYIMAVFRPVRDFVGQWIALGQCGVFLFFLVSGYIVPVSLERKGSVRSFWVRRAFRLYPVYALATAALAVLALVHLGSLAGAAQRPVSSVLGHLFMLSSLLNAPNAPYTVWTLSYEMVFYLLLTALFLVRAHDRSDFCALGFASLALILGGIVPTTVFLGPAVGSKVVDVIADVLIGGGLALAFSSVRRLKVLGAAVAAVTALTLVAVNHGPGTTAWQAFTILALMFTGTVLYRAEHGQVRRLRAVTVVTAVFTLILVALLGKAHAHSPHATLAALLFSQRKWFTSVALAALTFLAGMALRHRRVPSLLTMLGLVSYSVYLVHPLLLGIYRQVPWRPASQAVLEQVLVIAAFLAALLTCSALIYRFVETPAQRLGRRLARRLDQPGGSPPASPSAQGGREDRGDKHRGLSGTRASSGAPAGAGAR